MSFSTAELAEQGRQLQENIHEMATQLSSASRTAIEVVNPDLAGTELSEMWPLSFDITVEDIITVHVLPQTIGRAALREEYQPTQPGYFMNDKIDNRILDEAYDTDEPRLDFALDLIAWSEELKQNGWSVLTRLRVSDQGKLELTYYEDNEATRQFFETLTSGTDLTDEDIADGSVPYTALNGQIIVNSPDFAASVLASLEK